MPKNWQQATPANAPTVAIHEGFPSADWLQGRPEDEGLDASTLDALRDLVGGRGGVVRHGRFVYAWGEIAKSSDIASAVKPIISTLLLLAIQQGKVSGVDSRVAEFEPALQVLNAGKDGAIIWRHLASQTSGYGLVERPGEAYSYNDF